MPPGACVIAVAVATSIPSYASSLRHPLRAPERHDAGPPTAAPTGVSATKRPECTVRRMLAERGPRRIVR